MAYLIVCCDGTWNDPNNSDGGVAAPTNVRQMFHFLPSKPGAQETRYQAGVGTGGLIDRAVGGILGYGLSEDIRDCYQWLADKYQAGDQIILLGFSRGAYTARSLAGMITQYGLVNLTYVQDEDRDKVVKQVYREGYRQQESRSYLEVHCHLDFHPDSDRVLFLGVWDTVGTLGVPNDKALLDLFDNPKNYEFHDVCLSPKVECARHAVAIDEERGSFCPTLWATGQHPDVKQLWFPGVHGDVGGGYREKGLSDGALNWMIEELKHKVPDLVWDASQVRQITPDPQDELHESHKGFMKLLVTAPRSIPNLDQGPGQDCLHTSVIARREHPPRAQGPYRSTQLLSPQHPVTIDIYARHQWYWTGIYLEADRTYQFSANGAWVDSNIACGPGGTKDGKFYAGELLHVVGSLTGKLESVFKNIFDKEDANFVGTKRVESSPWFCLMGAIANSGNPGKDGTHGQLQLFEIGAGAILRPNKSGYLYCFANDAWGFYGNNRGYVTLTVTQGDGA